MGFRGVMALSEMKATHVNIYGLLLSLRSVLSLSSDNLRSILNLFKCISGLS